MSRSLALSHLVRQPDRSYTGVWGIFQLKSAFQPIFTFENGRLIVTGFEGLIRPWRDGQPISPGEFFPTFVDGERFHIETLTRTLHLLNASEFLGNEVSIFVNFDPGVFSDPQASQSALRDMRLVLHEAEIEPGRVVCEVTENPSASDAMLRSFVTMLRDHGYKIAVDDYGADDSDMARVQELKPDIVKFDALWISRLMSTGPGIALLKSMVNTFNDQGITTLFEGLEDGWQVEKAEQCDVSMVQGFALGRPLTVPADFSQFLKTRTSGIIAPVSNGETVHSPNMFAASSSMAHSIDATAAPPRQPSRSAKPFGRRSISG